MRFNSTSLPARDRFAAFRDGFVSRFAALEMIRHEAVPFRGDLWILRSGSLSAARFDTSPLTCLRTPQLLRDGDDSICLIVCRRGHYRVTQNERFHELNPGEAVAVDASRVAAIHATKDSSRLSIKIPRDRLTRLLPSIEGLGGHKLVYGSSMRLLSHYLDGARNLEFAARPQLGEMFDAHVLDLVSYILGAKGEPRRIVENRSVRYARYQAILDAVEQRFSEPDLSAATLAAPLGITARYIHRILDEENGKSFSQLVLEKRLDHAMQLLRDPFRSSDKIVDIATEVGFTDLSHFNRSFRRRFADTPSGARARKPRATGREAGIKNVKMCD